jgi:hypothetical protein
MTILGVLATVGVILIIGIALTALFWMLQYDTCPHGTDLRHPCRWCDLDEEELKEF